jgi:HK97 family phage prohead protease
MKKLEFKSFDITEHKADDSGNLIITGYGAFFGNLDSYKDIIAAGAFAETLAEKKDRIAFCYQHDIWNPIGKIQDIKEDDKGLWLKVMLSAAEDDIQTKVKEGILKEMSIGYRVVDSSEEMRNGDQVRILKKINLYEISLVTIAANPLAVIQSMKSDERTNYLEKEFDRVLAIVRNENINFEIQKLKSLVFSDLPTQEVAQGKEPQMKASIIFDSNFFTNNLNL